MEDEEHRSFETTQGEFVSAVVDLDIAKFDEFFQSELRNDPLTKGEKAIIKTYLLSRLMRKNKAAGA